MPPVSVVDGDRRAESRLEALRDSSDLPDQPDRAWVDDWLHRSHLAYWAR